MVYIFLANGFEEIEALTVVDILRRGGVEIKTVSVADTFDVTGSHKIAVRADIMPESIDYNNLDAVVLPGGLPGTPNLLSSETVKKTLEFANENNRLICAICAAPSVIGLLGYLSGKRATSYPGYEDKLVGAEICGEPVVHDNNIITSRSAGTAHLFAFEILRTLKTADTAEAVKASMLYE